MLDKDVISDAYAHAVRSYIASRRELIPNFVDRHFSMSGALRIHRKAVGLDVVRAPMNVLASVATVGKKGLAVAVRGVGAKNAAQKINDKNLFLKTKVGQEIEWLIQTELLELPFQQGDRLCEKDVLLDMILAQPALQNHLEAVLKMVAERKDDEAFRAQIDTAMAEYLGSRAAAADMTSSLFAAATGFLAYHKFTPGVAALSSSVAGSIAHSAAVSSYWAGSWLGGLYYSIFSVKTPALLFAGVMAGIMIPLAALTAFAGVVADPLQRRFGLHQRRLNKLLDNFEETLLGNDAARFVVRDHYVARVMDFVDWSYTILRIASR